MNNLMTVVNTAAAAAKSLQLCLTLGEPIDGSPPSSSVPGILQAGILEWVASSFSNTCMHAKSLQLRPILCDPIDSSPPGSPVPGILQAGILEWVAISFSNCFFLIGCNFRGVPLAKLLGVINRGDRREIGPVFIWAHLGCA